MTLKLALWIIVLCELWHVFKFPIYMLFFNSFLKKYVAAFMKEWKKMRDEDSGGLVQ